MAFRPFASFVVVSSIVVLAACSADVVNPSGSSGSNSSGGGSGGGGGGTDTPGTPPGTGDGGSSSVPPASATEAPVTFDRTCAAFSACGGSIGGTYDYTAGCVDNVFDAAKTACPTIDVSGTKVTVTGSLHFTSGNKLTRASKVNIAGQVIVPATCARAQCAAVEAELRKVFDSASCTGNAACTCTISDAKSANNTTTYAVSGSTVTTDDGETYSFCSEGSTLRYQGRSAGSEDGEWSLKKR